MRRQKAPRKRRKLQGFNPRTRRACDRPQLPKPRKKWSFNPRTRRACDTSSIVLSVVNIMCFNPRTRRACDRLIRACKRYRKVSIHARVERATQSRPGVLPRVYCFNPRTRRACDGFVYIPVRSFASFNPRTRRACDGQRTKNSIGSWLFQSTHA